MRIQPGEAQGYRLFLDDPFQITELPTYFKESHISDWRVQRGVFPSGPYGKNMMGLLISLIIVVAISNIVTSLSLMVVINKGNRYFAKRKV